MPAQNHARQQQLEDAFLVFNQVSGQLSDSYRKLQEQIIHLNGELAAARTDRLRQLAEKECLANRLSHLLEVLPAAVVVLDGSGSVQEFNPAAARLLGNIAEGRPWLELYRESFTGERSGDEFRLRDGGLITLSECSLAPEPGRILLLLDVTETRELQGRVNRQERLSTLGEMAAQLAHQIRTPLASALLDTSHLARNDLPIERRRQFSSRLKARLQHVEHQIKDMLAFARGGQGSVEPVSITSLIESLGQMVEPLLKSRNARFKIIDRTGGCFFVRGNEDALLGALLNLANNALDHGCEQVQLHVELSITPEASLEIQVCDNGPGIPDELAGRVFDPFFTTSSDGTGLGLAVVQSVVLAHEGYITITPSSLGGACFQLRLPLYKGSGCEEAVPVGNTGVDKTCSRSLS